MSLFANTQSIPKMRPQLNVGALFDIPTGCYHVGEHGEHILNSGLSLMNSVAGPGNSFKTAIMLHLNLTACERYKPYVLGVYDSENSLNYERIAKITERFEKMGAMDHSEDLGADTKIVITSAAEQLGDKYFEDIKTAIKNKIKDKKTVMCTSPFVNAKGEKLKVLNPDGIMIDSLSNFEITAVTEKMTDKHGIGESGQNMTFMKQGVAKKNMIAQMPNLAAKGGIYFSMVAHIGDEFEMDPYAPKKHKLTHSKRGSKITGTTKNFEFLNNMLWEIFSASPFNNEQRLTGVKYPLTESDREPDSTDLMLITAKLTRNKHGSSGHPIELVLSQREGLLPHLSQFHYVKTIKGYGDGGYGFEGNAQNYALSLCPEVKLSRTTVRGKIDGDYSIRRALEITSEMLQINQLWADLDEGLMCTPAELYDGINEQGYDWDVLLGMTRGYWVFEEEEDGEEFKYLSTMDLLYMRKGDYRPWWYDELVAK